MSGASAGFTSFPAAGQGIAGLSLAPNALPPAAPAQAFQANLQAKAGGDALRDEEDRRHLAALSARLLDAISTGDYLTYSCLVADDVTCFEPEACGHLVTGVGFHKYYFDLMRGEQQAAGPAARSSLVEPHVRIMGDVAVVAGVRLVQRGRASVRCEETRVWRREAATGVTWKLVHFHRSQPANAFG
mmetsp:Transcript_6710/g.19797  ORF Transcript_6710/g.19797 Transcript_6710/m.19797 type:complete len:187 (+) Transcript_6710:239-799(+)